MKKLLLIFAAFGLLMTSCQKDLDTATDAPLIDASKAQLLMNGYWQLTGYTINPNVNDSNAFPVDYFPPIPGCEKDNLYKFQSKTLLTIFEGNSKCILSAPDSVDFTYSLTNDEQHIKIWSVPDDMEHSTIYDADITYPTTKKFIIYYKIYDDVSELTSGHTRTFEKLEP